MSIKKQSTKSISSTDGPLWHLSKKPIEGTTRPQEHGQETWFDGSIEGN